MNLFIIDEDPSNAAKSLCDRHVVKMCLEHTQILSSAIRLAGIEAGYRLTHKNHPVVRHACGVIGNVDSWFINHSKACFAEYTERYGKVHKSEAVFRELMAHLPMHLPGNPDFCCCIAPNTTIVTNNLSEAVALYRQCYQRKFTEQKMTWSKRSKPVWLKNSIN